jgi:hypothetical protein
VAADEVIWNYVPGGTNAVTGRPFDYNTRFAVTMHPHRVFYAKESEGAPYGECRCCTR